MDIVAIDEKTEAVTPEFPLVALLWPARGSTSQWIVLPLILMITSVFRMIVGFWGYSGFGKTPMHGDFEAQRHWMELTTSMPVSMWYYYDLPYWGLDYPPLTAYHSWICGRIGSLINPSWFALVVSRGVESQQLKVFMRSTVIVSEYLVYVPALVIFLRHYSRNQGTGVTSATIALCGILMQPATILIDHGHFQYNTVMLGFFVACLSNIYAGRLLWACVFFVASLGFKQMALYYAPVIFAYLLGSCFSPRFTPGRLILIAGTSLVAFMVVFAPLWAGILYDLYRNVPFQAPNTSSFDATTPFGAIAAETLQVVHRCFPFARGLFEDKVANFWCLTNTIYKFRKLEGIVSFPKLSAWFTLVSILPSAMIIGSNPKRSLLPYAFASSAWGFFLFSYQVHEKSVLLPLLPMTLLLGSKHGLNKEHRAWIGWANILGVWSMYPLLKRDELKVPYVVVTLLWAYLLGLPPTSVSCYYDPATPNVPTVARPSDDLHTITKILHFWYLLGMVFWHLFEAFEAPPTDKPDLWVVINACAGAVGFGICYLWCTWKLMVESELLDEYFAYQRQGPVTEKKTQ